MAAAGLAGMTSRALAAETEAAYTGERPETWDAEADVVVVGSGAAGASAAWFALNGGLSVCLLEQMEDLGGSAIENAGQIGFGATNVQKRLGYDTTPEHFLTLASSRPMVLTQWPRAHSVRSRPAIPLHSGCLPRGTIALLPFSFPTTLLTAYFGATLRHMCMWSAQVLPPAVSTPSMRPVSIRNISPTSLLASPYRTFLLYFGTRTTW